jgi:hypothetical protein
MAILRRMRIVSVLERIDIPWNGGENLCDGIIESPMAHPDAYDDLELRAQLSSGIPVFTFVLYPGNHYHRSVWNNSLVGKSLLAWWQSLHGVMLPPL